MSGSADVTGEVAEPRSDPERPDSVWRGIGTVFTWVLLAVVIAALAASVVVPRVIGGVSLTVLTGSMRPTIQPGDLIVVKPVAFDEVQIGDIVTFQPISDDPTVITHRVVAKTFTSGETMFVTRGDANGTDDEPITGEQIRGRHIYTVPKLGFVAQVLGGNRTELVLIVGGGLVVVSLGAFIAAGIDRRKRRRGAADSTDKVAS
ncbi:signal peptidase I [Agromyces atrinae]|uniref:Signal peptidase I n=1 Tax=Agromyces atrinae TaxID=592376 RepID=A0A852SKE0_9MICO|nr:signal peptidase I [Agromyces atrinae]NYD67859.1 signal peptidase [Agromyces atrinae]